MWKIVRGLVAASLSLAAQLEVIIRKGGGRLLLKMQLRTFRAFLAIPLEIFNSAKRFIRQQQRNIKEWIQFKAALNDDH